jgi:hypothetical protein
MRTESDSFDGNAKDAWGRPHKNTDIQKYTDITEGKLQQEH